MTFARRTLISMEIKHRGSIMKNARWKSKDYDRGIANSSWICFWRSLKRWKGGLYGCNRLAVKVCLLEDMDSPLNTIMFEREFDSAFLKIVDKEFMVVLRKLMWWKWDYQENSLFVSNGKELRGGRRKLQKEKLHNFQT